MFAAGSNLGNANNTIDYITFASAGNATDFGDTTAIGRFVGATSGAHGGIG